MSTVISILLLLVRIYTWILIFRIIIEMIGSFSRDFRPPRWFSLMSEPLFLVTDPPVKALRRLIPPLRMGNIGLDMSVLVLFFALQLVQILLSSMVV
ncbi:MAG: YggT family protein [Corynebacterium glucuronolyticum]|nr:YggT family protein [Corynebacterium glucuronolyticum]MDD7587466.1 YggT family protein [Mycobacteriaceae bacterium]MDY5834431.1 YggT family protein [Corynebacterium glucuronolyticum]